MAINEDLTGFIREALNRGVSRDDIRGALHQADWPEDEIEAALRGFAVVDLPLAVPRPRPSLSAREAFLYLVLFGTLYVSAYSLGALLFQLTNLALPDPTWPQNLVDSIPETIRWAVAALVVSTRSTTVSTRYSSLITPPSLCIGWLRLKPVATRCAVVGLGSRSPASCSVTNWSKGRLRR